MAILERDKIQRQIATLGMEVPSDSVEDYVGEHGGDGTGPGGTSDYEKLKNKPQINGVELIGDLSAVELGLAALTDIPESQDLSIFRPSADEDIINNELQRQITENESAILTEAQRAGQAEGALQTAIQNEAQRAAQAEGILQGKISQNAVGIAATDAKLPRQYEEYTGIGFQAPDVATALYATQGQRVKGLRIWIINEEKWYVFENGIADSDFVIEGKTGGYFQTNIGFTVHSAIDQILADVTWFYTGAGIEQMFSNPMPMADESQPGFQSKENVLALKKAIADIASLQQGMTSEDTGIRAATYADLLLVIADPLWNTGDWALVTADENNNGATVRYTWNADTQSWEFDRIMSLSAIEVATDLAAGIVLSTPQLTGGIKNYGRILVEQTGVM
ncbi:MAG: hypothetical protein FWE67_15405, partial [Planctomycetaceae bacterium]|nr:hypothetical protein [Planctomycetaceae bacterium]